MNDGSKIYGNENASYDSPGGGIYVSENGIFTMNGGEIGDNIYDTDLQYRGVKGGGGVYVDENGSFSMTGGVIYNNKTSWIGGGVFINQNVYTTAKMIQQSRE